MNWFKKYIYLLPIAIFIPALGNFFSGDDWFHLRISQINSLTEFFNFFSFAHTAQSASFYRPLSTQVFFFIFQKLFGLTAWPYYLFGLILFAYTIHLVFKFSGSKLAAFIYAVSVSNFTRIYFLSAYQELFLVIFSLLTLIYFGKKPLFSLLFFILALLSKETAIVVPLLIVILNLEGVKKNYKFFGLFLGVATTYLYFRLFYFGLVAGDSYLWNFSPIKLLNTSMWYVLWSFGAPELLVDYVGSGLKLVPKFFIDYPYWWKITTPLLLGTVSTTILLLIQKIGHCEDKSPWQSRINLVKYIIIFLVSILPVLFLPSHKFALELGLPLVGFSMAIAWLIPKRINILASIFLIFYLLLNLSMNYLTYTRHYSVSRSEISKKVFQYFSVNYPKNLKGTYFEFINDSGYIGEIWGQSKQVSQALSGPDFIKVFYKDHSVEFFYEDYNNPRPSNKIKIPISTVQFL